MPVKTTIQLRRGTAAAWTSANPVLAAGEAGLETDTGKIKFGDGTTAWASLAYFTGSGGFTGFATPAIALGTAAAAGAATTGIRSDSTIVAFDATAPVTQAFGDAAAVGAAAVAARRDHKHGMPANPTGLPLGLTGATAATRYVGATTSGHPVSGTFAVGDFVIDQSGSGWVCTVAGTPGTWVQMSGGSTSPLTTKGDVFGHSTVDARVPIGTDGQVLTADSTQALGLKWATPSTGFADPTTTKGDLIVHGTSTTRLGVGSDGQVLTADSAQTLGVKWAAASGGGGGSASGADLNHPAPLDAYAINGTYGDDFAGTSLAARWTRRNFTSGAETWQVGPRKTYLRLDPAGRANGDGYFQTAPAGDWTIAMKQIIRFTDAGFGLAVVDTAGTGVAFLPAYNPHTPNAPLLVGVTTYSTYGGTYYEPYKAGSSAGPNLNLYQYAPTDIPVWTYLRKAGTNYYAAYSLDGEVWSPEAGPIAWAGTVDRVGMMLIPPQTATLTNVYFDIDWFNRIDSASLTGGVGSTAYPYTVADIPPTTPDSRNEEFNGAPVNTWSDATNSGTPTNGSLGANLFDSAPANPTWNANADIPGAMLMQPKAGTFYKRYMSFAPTVGTRWGVVAKIRLMTGTYVSENLFAMFVSKEAPGAVNWNPTDGVAVRLAGGTVASPQNIDASTYNGGGESRSAHNWAPPFAYVAITGTTANAINCWASADGVSWMLLRQVSALNINANVNYLGFVAYDVTNNLIPTLGVVEYVRFLAGSSDLWATFGIPSVATGGSGSGGTPAENAAALITAYSLFR